MKVYITICLIGLVFIGKSQTVIYAPSSQDFSNPERGFYAHYETFSNNHTALSLGVLQDLRTKQNTTLILRLFYLNSFVNSNISQSYLNAIQTDFNTIRNAGLKCIVRFAYTNQNTSTPYGDATKTQILAHINQLKPLLNNNADIIYVMQAGFIGSWGEWYSSDYFGTYPFNALDYQNRREVLDSILSALPRNRMVQVRTPWYKQNMYNTNSAIKDYQAFNENNLSRIGYHNDCFLTDYNDYGTFVNPTNEYPYLSDETKYLPMGGETCQLFPPRSNCDTADKELSLFHWSYLNSSYNPQVIDYLNTNGCLGTIKKKLGYRYQLLNGTYPANLSKYKKLRIVVNIQNEGYASLINYRPAYIILKNVSTNNEYKIPLSSDFRYFLHGANLVDENIVLPQNIISGNYKLYLYMPDASSTIASRSEYAVRFANESVWESTTGYNNLSHTISINDNMAITDFNPKQANLNDTIIIRGTKLTGVDKVKFGGINAKSFQVLSDTIIKAVVDTCKSGYVTIEKIGSIDSVYGFTFCKWRAIINSSPVYEICKGESFTLIPRLDLGYKYKWYRDFTLLTDTISKLTGKDSGNYFVIIMDSLGCMDTSNTIQVKINPSPILSKISGDSVVFLNGINNYGVFSPNGSNYNWFYKNGSGTITNNNSISITWSKIGFDTIKVVVTNQFACKSDTSKLNINVVDNSGINIVEQNLANIYPNSNNGKFYISAKISIISFQVFDIAGNQVYYQNLHQPQLNAEADVSLLTDGIYFIKVQFENGSFSNSKIVLNK